jgi:hypothetical protein
MLTYAGLNELLRPYGIAFGQGVFRGAFSLGVYYIYVYIYIHTHTHTHTHTHRVFRGAFSLGVYYAALLARD